ncbi:MAG: hypothetical protein HYS25_00415 [Ignavibacteriales bacterium]|nr:hypothetical protein [Ignavibacteriales bacterium]
MKRVRLLFLFGLTAFAFPLLFFSSLITIPYEMSSYAQVYPQQKWILSKGTDGQIISNLIDFTSGGPNEFDITQFDRGETVSFSIAASVKGKSELTAGDTIAKIYSSQISERIMLAEGKLAVARAALHSQSTGEKDALIKEAKTRLDYSKEKVNENKNLFLRKEQLFERGLISQEEFDIQKWELKLSEIEENIYRSQLEALTTGVKSEEINLLNSNIDALNTELNFLKDRNSKLAIVSPIDGIISPTLSEDTLLTVLNIENVVLNIPIKVNEAGNFRIGDSLKLLLETPAKKFSGKLLSVTKEVKILNNEQVLFLGVLVHNKNQKLVPGMVIKSDIVLEPLTPWQHFEKFITE